MDQNKENSDCEGAFSDCDGAFSDCNGANAVYDEADYVCDGAFFFDSGGVASARDGIFGPDEAALLNELNLELSRTQIRDPHYYVSLCLALLVAAGPEAVPNIWDLRARHHDGDPNDPNWVNLAVIGQYMKEHEWAAVIFTTSTGAIGWSPNDPAEVIRLQKKGRVLYFDDWPNCLQATPRKFIKDRWDDALSIW